MENNQTKNETVSQPIFKGRKLSQFHLDYVAGMLDEITSGKINTIEAWELLKEASIRNGEAVLETPRSLVRCVEILLKDKPEELKAYYEVVSNRSNKRSRQKVDSTPGLYYEKQETFKRQIINYYLPLMLKRETTFDIIAEELSTTHHTINKVIEDYYKENNDFDGLRRYQEIKKRNSGASLEKRQNARNQREKVANYDIVTNEQFLGLSPEEQEAQVMMKIRLEKLKEEQSPTSKRKSALQNEDVVRSRINCIMNYFRTKNNVDSRDIYFSDVDIRYMIFRYPTLINRTSETLDEKISVLTSYEDLDKETVYRMIKTFPGIMGNNAARIKRQLDILEEEGLIDAIITDPQRLKLSPELIYALIQFSKTKRKTSDLTGIKRAYIFLSNSSLQRIYHVSYDDIKAKYPYVDLENAKKNDTNDDNEERY